jgi:hypothetical protein
MEGPMTRPWSSWLVLVLCPLLAHGGRAAAEESPAAPAASTGTEAAAEVEPGAPAAEAEEAPEATEVEAPPAAAAVAPETSGGQEVAAEAVQASEAGTPTQVAPAEDEPGRFARLLHELEGLDETAPVFTLSRGTWGLSLLGSVQLLGIPFIQDPYASIEAGSIANTEGFRLRRARFGISGAMSRWFDVVLRFELGENGADLLDANLSFDAHELARISAGALKVPFSHTMLLESEHQSMLDRPYAVRTIAPDRSLGLSVSGRLPWLSYAAGVFNGGGDYYRGDNNEGMLYAARVVAHPLGPLPEGEITLPESFVFQVGGSYYFNQDATGDRHAAQAEAIFRWAGLTVMGEFLWSTFFPSGNPVTTEGVEYGHTERMGWFGEASYFILAEHLQVAVRYEGQLVREAVEAQDLNDLWAISGAVSGYLLRGRIKLSLEYQHRHEWFETQVPNDYLALQLQGRI